MPDAPSMNELLGADAPTNWGKWGDDDEVGALNYLGPEQVLAAVRLVSTGKVFTLQRLIGDPEGRPGVAGPHAGRATQVLDESTGTGAAAPPFPGGLHYADDKIDAFLQGSTQYDALGHVWYDGKIWNGYDARTTVGGLEKASVAADRRAGRRRARRPDRHGPLPRQEHARQGRDVQPRRPARPRAKAQGVEIQKHDILIIRTGFLKLFHELARGVLRAASTSPA